jgi:hypothetical protein
MSKPQEKLSTLERSLSVLAICFAGLAFIPGISFWIRVVLALYVIELVVYLVSPWESWRWKESNGTTLKRKRLFAQCHRWMFVVWFCMLFFCFAGALSTKFLPEITDDLILDRFSDATKNVVLHNSIAQLSLDSSSQIDASHSLIGVVRGQTLHLLPTPALGAALLAPGFGWFANFGAVGLLLLFVGGVFLLFAEKNASLELPI